MTKEPRLVKSHEWLKSGRQWNGTFTGRDVGADVTILNYTFETVGDGPKWHVHTYDEIFIIRTGRARFTVGERKFDAEAGDVIFGPAGVPHKFENLGPGALETIDIHMSDAFAQTVLDDPELA